jgi:hypothetical protein
LRATHADSARFGLNRVPWWSDPDFDDFDDFDGLTPIFDFGFWIRFSFSGV